MTKVVKGIVGAVSLAVAIFAILAVFGLYCALNAAPSYTLGATSETDLASNGSGLTGNYFPLRSPGTPSGEGVVTEGGNSDASQASSEGDAPLSVLSAGTGGNTSSNGSDSNTGTYGGTSGSASSNSSSKPNTSSPAGDLSNNANNGASFAGTTNPPQTTTPEKTYYPAWDEWVESGYWEDVTYAATYGERAVYGSLCNSCGANISGSAAAHLKETHHSGYHEGVVGYESYEISPARSVKEWKDTSHWQHHEGYWG